MSTAFIGGSGLYSVDEKAEEIVLETPYGAPSDSIYSIDNGNAYFLARHGQSHKILPHEINHRANIWALKKLGVKRLISLSAAGSLREDIHPGDFVLVDQFIDMRRGGLNPTFFGDGAIAHVSFAEPVCQILSKAVAEILDQKAVTFHDGGTYVNILGPAFSSKAESEMYRNFGADVIGMTNYPEARLCREAEIAYLTIAMITDYDCWHPQHDDVTVEQVIGQLLKNGALAKALVPAMIARVSSLVSSDYVYGLRGGLMTPVEAIPEVRREELEPLLAAYR